jgi:hypothetical protein
MADENTPYDYGEAETEALGDDPAHERQHDRDTVIVDGSAMSYRRYTVEED